MTAPWMLRDTTASGDFDIILVDENDRPVGLGLKGEVHQVGRLHRAFSVFIVNQDGDWLLQQRAADKYHSPSLWSNACCSHPRPGESVYEAAKRRLKEELGIKIDLDYLGTLVYRVNFEDDLWEHEYDHLFLGRFEGPFYPDPAEVKALRWVNPGALRQELESDPEQFTYWFKAVMAGGAVGPDVHKLFPVKDTL